MEDTLSSQHIDYLGMLRRRRLIFLVIAVLGTCISVAVALLLPSIYKSTSTILIEEQEIPPDLVMSTVTSYAEQRLEIIKQRIMSTSRLLEIANRYKLYAAKRDRWTTEELVEQMRKDIILEYINADVMDRRTGKPSTVTIAFTLSYEGKESPETVRDVAQVLASLFLEENIKVRERQVSEASSFFEDEMKRVKADLDSLDPRIADFKKEHLEELPELLPVNRQSLYDVERRLELLAAQKRVLIERKSTLQTQLAQADDSFMNQKPVENEKRRLEEMKSQLAILTAKYTDAYPDVFKLRHEVAEMQERMLSTGHPESVAPDNPVYLSLTNELTGIDDQLRGLDKQAAEMESSAELYKRHIAATPGVEGGYRALMGERDSLEKQYLELTAKFMEAQVAEGLEKGQKGERFTIIDPAALPEQPYKPNRPAIMLLGMFFAVVASAGFVMLREFMDKAVHSPEALLMAVRLPLLSVVPLIVTRDDCSRKRRRRLMFAVASVCVLVAGMAGSHYFYMDLNVVFAKLLRKVPI